MVYDSFGDPVTEERWLAVAAAIDLFAKKYPRHWAKFMLEMHEDRTDFALALEGDLKKASWRNTMALPVIYRHATEEEKKDVLTGEEEDDLIQVASLQEVLLLLIPGFQAKDEQGKPNKLYREFLKRFQIFNPANKF